MNLYTLDGLAFPKLNQFSGVQKEYQTIPTLILREQVIYAAQIIADKQIILWRINIPEAEKMQWEVKFNIGNLRCIKFIGNRLIILTREKLLGYIGINKVINISKYGISLVAEKDFEYTTIIKNAKSKIQHLEVIIINQKIVTTFLADNAIFFHQMNYQQNSDLKLKMENLVQDSESVIIYYKTFLIQKNKIKLGKQHLCVFLVLQTIRKQLKYAVIDILWSTKQFSVKQLAYYLQQNNSKPFSFSTQIIGSKNLIFSPKFANDIVICEKTLKGWEVMSIIKIDYSVQRIFKMNFESKTFLVVGKINKQRNIMKYDIQQLQQNMEINPLIISKSDPIDGQFIQYYSTEQSKVGLFISRKIYILAPVFFQLSLHMKNLNSEMLQSDKNIQSNCLNMLSYSKFLSYIQTVGKKQNPIKQLFSSQKLISIAVQFERLLNKWISSSEKRKIIIFESLLKQYLLIWIYLCSFLKYLHSQNYRQTSYQCINWNNLIVEFRKAQSGLNLQVKLIQYPKVEQILGNNFRMLKSNILAMLTLNKGKKDWFSQISINEILHFMTDHTYLVNYLVFMLFYYSKKKQDQQWQKIQSILHEIVSLRNDYPPMIAFLCNKYNQYTLNKFHLHHCRFLSEIEKKNSKNIVQQLHFFKDVQYYAASYLKNMKMTCLQTFMYCSQKDKKYNDCMLVIQIPEYLEKEVKTKWKNHLISLQQKYYLLLDENHIAKMFYEFSNPFENKIFRINEDPLDNLTSQLTIVCKIFIQQLRIQHATKDKIRKHNMEIRYDCKYYSNDVYQLKQHQCRLGRKLSSKQQFTYYLQKKMLNQSLLENGSMAEKRYFEKIFEICKFYHIAIVCRIIDQQQIKTSTTQTQQNIFQIDQSRIKTTKIDHSSNPEQKQEQYISAILSHLWDVYDCLAQISQYEYEVQEELQSTKFASNFIKIVGSLHNCSRQLDNFYIKRSTFSKSIISKINDNYILGNKINIIKQSQGKVANQKYILRILKNFLIRQLYSKNRKWIASFDDLLLQSSLLGIHFEKQFENMVQAIFDCKIIKKRK